MEDQKKFTATEMSMRTNIRRQRADVLMNEILHAIRPFVDRDAEERIYRALRSRLEEHGAEIISDYTRKEAGLPPRGPDGWTAEEMMALEKVHLDALCRPFPMMIVPKDAISTTEPCGPMTVPKGYEIRPVKCGGCGAPSTEFCRRPGGNDCFREFHGEGTRAPWAANDAALKEHEGEKPE